METTYWHITAKINRTRLHRKSTASPKGEMFSFSALRHSLDASVIGIQYSLGTWSYRYFALSKMGNNNTMSGKSRRMV